jgi:hypothetical protein
LYSGISGATALLIPRGVRICPADQARSQPRWLALFSDVGFFTNDDQKPGDNQLVLIKHLHTAELILAADTASLRTSSTPLTNDHPRFILEPYSRGPQTETRTHHDCAYPSTHES